MQSLDIVSILMFNFAYPNNTDLLKQAFTLKDINSRQCGCFCVCKLLGNNFNVPGVFYFPGFGLSF